jgi:hypothetical protein
MTIVGAVAVPDAQAGLAERLAALGPDGPGRPGAGRHPGHGAFGPGRAGPATAR